MKHYNLVLREQENLSKIEEVSTPATPGKFSKYITTQ